MRIAGKSLDGKRLAGENLGAADEESIKACVRIAVLSGKGDAVSQRYILPSPFEPFLAQHHECLLCGEPRCSAAASARSGRRFSVARRNRRTRGSGAWRLGDPSSSLDHASVKVVRRNRSSLVRATMNIMRCSGTVFSRSMISIHSARES